MLLFQLRKSQLLLLLDMQHNYNKWFLKYNLKIENKIPLVKQLYNIRYYKILMDGLTDSYSYGHYMLCNIRKLLIYEACYNFLFHQLLMLFYFVLRYNKKFRYYIHHLGM